MESLDRLNKSLVQVENCKDIAKWLLKTLKIALRQSVEPTKLEKFILTTIGLDDESKLAILKQLVIIKNCGSLSPKNPIVGSPLTKTTTFQNNAINRKS